MHSNEVETATQISSCDLENQFVIVGISQANQRSPPGRTIPYSIYYIPLSVCVWETLVICFSFLCHIIDFTCACLESSLREYYRPKTPPTTALATSCMGQVHFSFLTWFSCRKCCRNELISKIHTHTHLDIYKLGKASCIGQKFRLFGFWLNVVDTHTQHSATTPPLPRPNTAVINWLGVDKKRGRVYWGWPCCFCRLILFIDKPFACLQFGSYSCPQMFVHTYIDIYK